MSNTTSDSPLRRVLVVDDEPMVREVVTAYLERDGYRVTTAADGQAALEALETTHPDLVVLDGFQCMEGDGPVNGTAVDFDIAIASTDPVKADSLGARLLGLEPEEIGYLHYLQQDGMGSCSLEGLVGDDPSALTRTVRRHGTYDIQSQWQ